MGPKFRANFRFMVLNHQLSVAVLTNPTALPLFASERKDGVTVWRFLAVSLQLVRSAVDTKDVAGNMIIVMSNHSHDSNPDALNEARKQQEQPPPQHNTTTAQQQHETTIEKESSACWAHDSARSLATPG